jgi:hypothetical protein
MIFFVVALINSVFKRNFSANCTSFAGANQPPQILILNNVANTVHCDATLSCATIIIIGYGIEEYCSTTTFI